MKKWRAYERLVALLTSEEYDEKEFTVIPNAKITGYISKIKRQIDVLVEYRFDSDLTKRIIIDAKNKRRPIDVKEVEAFEGLMRDVNARRGFLICTNGYSKAALRRSQEHIGIRLIEEKNIETLDLNSWNPCLDHKCKKGLVLWDATPGIFHNGIVTVNSIGKCDECGKFHIWCWGCGNKKFLITEDEWQCDCKGLWFYITTIEPDDENEYKSEGNYLILVFANATWEILDRRPL